MSLQQVEPEETFYKKVKGKCNRMMRILDSSPGHGNSVFVISIQRFCGEFDTHHETRQQFVQQCQILENARIGYKKGELTVKQEKGIQYLGGAYQPDLCQILEELCVYIETYLEQRLFSVWHCTDTTRPDPNFPVERQTMKNLTSSLSKHAGDMRDDEDLLKYIAHLEENFDLILSELNHLRTVKELAEKGLEATRKDKKIRLHNILSEESGMSAQKILEMYGLQRIALKLCGELNLNTMEDLAGLTDVRVDSIAWLTDVQRSKLKKLCERCRQGHSNLMNALALIAGGENINARATDRASREAQIQALLQRMTELRG